MSGLPKKYAKMGFKKGWAEYKKAQRRRKSTGGRTTSKRKSTRRRSKPTVRVEKLIALDAINRFATGQGIPSSLVYQMSDGQYKTVAELFGAAPSTPMYQRIRYDTYVRDPEAAIAFLKNGITGEGDESPRLMGTLGEIFGYRLAKWALKKLGHQADANRVLKEAGLSL